MENIVAILLILAAGALPLLWILFLTKRRNTAKRLMIEPLAARGPRYRDGAVTYNQFDGVHYNVEVEGPGGGHSARYQRRHSRRQRKQTKPWEK